MKRFLLICAAAVTFSGPVWGAEPAGLSGSVPSGVARATLPNGLRVVVVPDPLAPVVSTALTYLAGSNDAPAGFPGTAHALEHMMFRGSTGLDRDQLAELGALLGGAYNASTSETVTQYTYTVPASDLSLALQSEALRMRGLTLDDADWARERGAIEQEVSRDLSSPFYNYAAAVQAFLFAGTPYEHDALGTRPSFDKTDTGLLRAFYDRWYAPNNAILVIAGDVQPSCRHRRGHPHLRRHPTPRRPAACGLRLGPGHAPHDRAADQLSVWAGHPGVPHAGPDIGRLRRRRHLGRRARQPARRAIRAGAQRARPDDAFRV